MVHKASDSMPRLRERTDFCYCCGLEVMPDYPHDEKDNPGARARTLLPAVPPTRPNDGPEESPPPSQA